MQEPGSLAGILSQSLRRCGPFIDRATNRCGGAGSAAAVSGQLPATLQPLLAATIVMVGVPARVLRTPAGRPVAASADAAAGFACSTPSADYGDSNDLRRAPAFAPRRALVPAQVRTLPPAPSAACFARLPAARSASSATQSPPRLPSAGFSGVDSPFALPRIHDYLDAGRRVVLTPERTVGAFPASARHRMSRRKTLQ